MRKALILGGVLFSVVVVAVLILRHIDDYADFWRMRETPVIKPHEEPMLIMEVGVVPVPAGEAHLRAIKGEGLKTPMVMSDPTVIAAGRSIGEPMLIMEVGIVPVPAGEAHLRATKGEDLKSPMVMSDPTVIAAGRSLYFTFCLQCHGPNHDGNATVGQSFHPLPTDLRDPKVQAKPEGVHFKEISYGVPDGRQPALATTIPVLDRWRIVAYVKSLGVRK